MYVKDGTSELKRVLVSRPEYLKPAPINEIAKKWKDTTMDVEKMLQEHQAFVEAYEKAGVAVEFLDADEERPNSVFARDFGGCVKEGYILGTFKLEMRYKEHVDYEKRMADLGIPKIGEVTSGCFEGGDFMFMNEHWIAVGMADRTDAKGLAELKDILEPLGYEVTGVPLKREYLHLDMCFNLVDDHLAVAYKDGLPEEFLDRLKQEHIEIISVPEAAIFMHGCNLQALGNHRVLSLKHNALVNAELSKRGMDVIELDITEILKAGGGPHCMTFPLERI
ncbi:MAG: nitrate reductase [Lachnospiraceae bacterium]|nr:nitrate reductase [Lachnospiraceae bacterium]